MSKIPELRGVSLIEMMVVVAILSIMAAIAAPQMLPITKKARLGGEAEAVASFLNVVRERAIAKNRCHRVLLLDASTPHQLTAEQRTSGDCATGLNFKRSDASVIDGWETVKTRLVAEKGTTYLYDQLTDCTNCTSPAIDEVNSIVFRPSGRLRGDNDLDPMDDRVRIRVKQSGLTEEKNVIVMGSGRICVVSLANGPTTITGAATASNDCTQAIP